MNPKERVKYAFRMALMLWLITISTAILSHDYIAFTYLCACSAICAIVSTILLGIIIIFEE